MTENSRDYWIVNLPDKGQPQRGSPPHSGFPIEFEDLNGYWTLLLDTPHLKIRRHEERAHKVTQLWVRG